MIFKKSKLYRDTSLPTPIGTNPFQSYSSLLGRVLSSPLSSAVFTDINTIVSRRLGSCPITRNKTYYVSPTGNDLTGDGSSSNPWRGMDAVNQLLRLDYTFEQSASGTTLSATNSAPYRFTGSWTVGGMINMTNDSAYGSVLGMTDFCWWLCPQGGTNGGPFCRVKVGGNDYQVDWLASVVDQNTHLIWARYDSTTKVLSIGVDAQTPKSITLPADPDVSVGDMKHNGGVYAAFGGYSGRIFAATQTLSNSELSSLYNNGKGHRFVTVPSAIKAKILSWWDLWRPAGDLNYTVFPDSKGVTPLTKPVGNANSVGVDFDSTVTGNGSGPVGGADLTVLFERGGRYEGVLTGTRSGVSLADYGTGAKPLLTLFSVQFPTWTFDTGTTYYAPCSEVVWLKPVGENDPDTFFRTPLSAAQNIADCRSTLNSCVWDSSSGRVYINVGGNPNTVCPSGWEGVPGTAGMALSYILSGANLRIHNLNIVGGGIGRPGTNTGYGLQLTLPSSPANYSEQVVTNCDIFYTGYHALGFIQDQYAVALSAGNRCGLITARNPSVIIGDQGPATGTTYVYYVGNPGNNEIVSYKDVCWGGVLKDWTGAAPNGVGGQPLYAHDGPAWPLFLVYNFESYGQNNFGYTLGVVACSSTARSVGSSTGLVISPKNTGTAKFQDLSTGIGPGSCLINYVGYGLVISQAGYIKSIAGVGDGPRWIINCDIDYDFSSSPNSVSLYGNYPSDNGLVENYINSAIRFRNCGTKTLTMAAAPFSGEHPGMSYLNTIFAYDGNTAPTLGSINAGSFNKCAFYNFASAGTINPVTLSQFPGFAAIPNQNLTGIGNNTGKPAYDTGLVTRSNPPSIGPKE